MINWDRVNTLRADVGAEDFDDVVGLFFSELDSIVARLRAAPDPATLEQDLHFLKGSALELGFETLSTLCQAGESSCAKGAADDVDLNEILCAYDESKVAFKGGGPAAPAGTSAPVQTSL